MGMKKKGAGSEPTAKAKQASKPSAKAKGSPKPDAPPRSPPVETEGSSAPPASPVKGGTELGTKIAASVSLIAVIVLAVLVNIYSARHFVRWDLTKGGEFTLSAATVETLRGLDEPVHVIVLSSKDSPIGGSLAEILESYQMHSKQLETEFVDPDRDRIQLFEVQKKYGLATGESEGRVLTDALMVVVQGDRHRFVRQEDLERVEDSQDMRVRPSLEYALTSAIRRVRIAERKTICFTAGHGEPPLEAGGAEGMAELAERLTKNNYAVTTVFDSRADAPPNPLSECDVLVLAAPRARVSPEHVQAMRTFIENGGNALLWTWPVPNPQQTAWVELGVSELFALAGVVAEDDIVFELDPARRPPRGNGEAFFAKPGVHPITEQLVKEEEAGVSAVVVGVQSLRDLGTDVKPEALLVASPKALGVVGFWDRRLSAEQLKPTADDHAGPMMIAAAAQRAGKDGKRGARVVVLQGASTLLGINWSAPDLRGNTLLVEASFSWLASHERFLDIPDKPLKATGVRLTEDAIHAVSLYVLVVIPGVVATLGIALFLVRRRRPEPVAKEKAT